MIFDPRVIGSVLETNYIERFSRVLLKRVNNHFNVDRFVIICDCQIDDDDKE